LEEVFSFFGEAVNLETITPRFLEFRILSPRPIQMAPGTLIDYVLRLHGVKLRWRTEIREWNPPFGFTDVQLRGPYKTWIHQHRFEAVPGGTLMRDVVHYELPLGWLGRLVERWWVRRDVERIFDYRAQAIGSLWRRQAA
jgi:ligand-binding SRPBCC domain-containing protein